MDNNSTIVNQMASMSLAKEQEMVVEFRDVCRGVRGGGVGEIQQLIDSGFDLKTYAIKGVLAAMDKDNVEVFKFLVELPYVKKIALQDSYTANISFFQFGVIHNSVKCLRHLHTLGVTNNFLGR